MNSFFALILLQINLLGSSGEPMTGTKVYAQDAVSNEIIAFTKVGQSGKFKFSNLDPGNYLISLDIPESAVKKVDKRDREKFDTNIEVAYNLNKDIYCWQRNDGYVTVEFTEKSKVAETLIPKFDIEESDSTAPPKVIILQITVIGKYGSFSGLLTAVGQKEFYNLTVGKKDIKLEDSGGLNVLKRTE